MIDRIEDAVSRDTQKAEHETLQEECKRLRKDVSDWRFYTALFVALFAFEFLGVQVYDDAYDALENRTASLRISLDSERARYRACFADRERDRESCVGVGDGWAVCMTGVER
jgi:hypothetical protein